MKCSIKLHVIWVYIICQSTHFGVTSIQRVDRLNIVIFSDEIQAQITHGDGSVQQDGMLPLVDAVKGIILNDEITPVVRYTSCSAIHKEY